MIARTDLARIARARLRDAEVLFSAERYDGAVYLCGYAIELQLKARICRTLQWPSFPSTRHQFQDLTSFRTHDLDVLLQLSGISGRILSTLQKEWDEMTEWEPEMRYNLIGSIDRAKARKMLDAAKALMRKI